MQTSEKTDLLLKLGGKKISKAQLYKMAEADYSLLPMLFEGTSSPKATVRYGCASVLMDLCGKHPDKLYPYMDRFVELLDSKHRILTWNALAAIATSQQQVLRVNSTESFIDTTGSWATSTWLRWQTRWHIQQKSLQTNPT